MMSEEEIHLCSAQPGFASDGFVGFVWGGFVLFYFEGFPVFKVLNYHSSPWL